MDPYITNVTSNWGWSFCNIIRWHWGLCTCMTYINVRFLWTKSGWLHSRHARSVKCCSFLFVALLPTQGVTRPCRKMMMCNCNMTYWKCGYLQYDLLEMWVFAIWLIGNVGIARLGIIWLIKLPTTLNIMCINFASKSSCMGDLWPLVIYFQFMRTGGKHCIIWMHKVLGMWWLEYRFGLHEGINHFFC